MNIKTRNQKKYKHLEKIKWLSIFMLCIAFILSIYYFYNINIIARILIISFFFISISGIILLTEKGKKGLLFIQESKQEMYKITWPQYKETIYTTCIIIVVTIIMSLILWGLDNIIFRLITFIISVRF